MTLRVPALSLLFALALSASTLAQSPPVHHNLHVVLQPDQGQIQVHDQIVFPREHAISQTWEFALHKRFQLLAPKAASLSGSTPRLRKYQVRLDRDQSPLELHYVGNFPVGDTAATEQKTQPLAEGRINAQEVYLDQASAWYPLTPDGVAFHMEVELPPGWLAVSQGKQIHQRTDPGNTTSVWEETHRQNNIYLVAGPFTRYQRSTPLAEALVYLRTADPTIAQRYLSVTEHYLALYEDLIGPYPYAKFAMVENIWETGYGMPSFTLLGARVLRLPFILYSSYPHEILHNWWGNSVYVDYSQGNWSEGLTAYLADHLIQQQRGQGPEYRRSALQKYADYVQDAEDFPLTRFRSRHNEATQAVGYNKTLMVFHMLRRQIGDRHFLEGLRRFYRKYRFQTASFRDLQQTFEDTALTELNTFFDQWLQRTGAPRLSIQKMQVIPLSSGAFRITGQIRQVQPGPAYQLRVPLAITLEETPAAQQIELPMATKSLDVDLSFSTRPVRMDVDPQFDLFRRLDTQERPPALGQVFGADNVSLILPSDAPRTIQNAYQTIARAWQRRHPGWHIEWDQAVEAWPEDHPVWIFGWKNRLIPSLIQRLATKVQLNSRSIQIDNQSFSLPTHSAVLTSRSSGTEPVTAAWLGLGDPEAAAGLARKLPHYGKYSYLVFAGTAPENILKGQWSTDESPLSVSLVPAGFPERGQLTLDEALRRDPTRSSQNSLTNN